MKMENHRLLYVMFFVLAVFGLGACDSTELTREKASVLLDNSEEFSSLQDSVEYHDNGYAKIIAQGVISGHYNHSATGVNTFMMHTMVLEEPFKLSIVDITGISDVPLGEGKLKRVEFNWQRSGLPEFTKRYVYRGGSGRSTMQLYDDGWRIIELKLDRANERFELTQSELEAEARDVKLEKERKRVELDALRRAQQAYADRVSKAKTSSKEIGKYQFNQFRMRSPITGTLALTDVGFSFSQPLHTESGAKRSFPQNIYFFDLFIPIRSDFPRSPLLRNNSNEVNIWLQSGTHSSATWSWKVNVLVFSPVYTSVGNTPLMFLDKNESERFAQDLAESFAKWYEKYKDLVVSPKTLDLEIHPSSWKPPR